MTKRRRCATCSTTGSSASLETDPAPIYFFVRLFHTIPLMAADKHRAVAFVGRAGSGRSGIYDLDIRAVRYPYGQLLQW